MKIFDKRPLSLILCIMLGGFVFFSYSIPAYKIAIPIIAVSIFAISFFIFNIEKNKLILFRLCAVALLISSLFSYLYFDIHFSIYKRYDDNAEIISTVDDIDTEATPLTVTLIIETVNSVDEKGFKIITYTDYDTFTNISEGSSVKIVGTLSGFDSAENYYKAEGISAKLTNISEIELLRVNEFNDSYTPSVYRDNLSREMILKSDAKSGGLLAALLLGEKTYLNSQTALDFQRTGTSHILALSGMHLAILTFTIGKILSILRFNKKSRKLIEIIFIISYMALTGFSPSVLRSGLMLIISSLLFLISRKSDSITSLFISVSLICIFDPCTAFDISLWLSMLATFGILVLSEMNAKIYGPQKEENSFIKEIFKNILFALLSSVFAISTTMLLTASCFDTMSPLGLFITPLISPIISLFMNIGLLFVLFSTILPLGPIIQFIGESIGDAIGYASSFKGIYTSSDFLIAKIIIIIFTICVVCFFVFSIKRKKTAVLIMCILLSANYITAIVNTAVIKKTTALDYSISGSTETVYISSDAQNAIINASTPNSYSVSASIIDLKERHLTEVDNYIFTNYSPKLIESAVSVLSTIYVETIHIPLPVNDEEQKTYNELCDILENYHTNIHYFGTEDMIFIGDITYIPVYRSTETDKLAFTIKHNDDFYSYVSPKMFETSTKAVAFSAIEGCHTLILGSHGSDGNKFDFSYILEDINALIVSSKSFNVSSNVTETNRELKVHVDPSRISLIR